ARFAAGKTSQAIDLDEVKAVLEGAGVNLASIDFAGALRCVVSRTEQAPVETPAPFVVPSTQPVALDAGSKTLRNLLIAEVAERFGLPVDSLQLRFSQEDEKTLALSEASNKFDI